MDHAHVRLRIRVEPQKMTKVYAKLGQGDRVMLPVMIWKLWSDHVERGEHVVTTGRDKSATRQAASAKAALTGAARELRSGREWYPCKPTTPCTVGSARRAKAARRRSATRPLPLRRLRPESLRHSFSADTSDTDVCRTLRRIYRQAIYQGIRGEMKDIQHRAQRPPRLSRCFAHTGRS
jgi:hypothetical protein